MLTLDYARLNVRAGDLVLDLGSGPGRHAIEAQRLGATVIAVDTALDDLARTRDAMNNGGRGGQVACADGRQLPFPDAIFDRVIVAEVLEHIPDDQDVLAEIRRVLRADGKVAVTVPRYWPERVCWWLSSAYHNVAGGHVRIYRRGQLRRRAARSSLSWVDSHHAHALHSPYWWLKCAVGVDRDTRAVRAYHRLLVWDMMHKPWITQRLETILNPVLGKSLVVYLKPNP